MELLEREALLGELGRLWDEARQGHGRFVFVGGEAGVGKTSLIRAFAGRVGPGARLMMGWCDPLSTPRPLGPLIDMAGSPDSRLARLLSEGAERDRLLPGVLAELQRGPVLMLVEDVHWADEATLDLLRYLGRRIEQAPAMVLATYRDDEIGPDHPLKRLLGDLATAPAVQRLRVDPLSEGAVRKLVGDRAVDAVALYRRTGGNPFYVTEILSAGEEYLPGTVRDAVLVRASRLSPEARDALAAAAVIGPVIEPWLLADITGNPAAIDECVTSGMLQMTGAGVYGFRHELAREAINDATLAERRRTLHWQVVRALEQAPDLEPFLVRLAHHAEEAGEADRVLSYASAAAKRARSASAHREAAAQLRRALRFSAGLPDQERATTLEALATECQAISRLSEGITAREEAIALWRKEGSQLKVAENLSRIATLLVLSSRNAEAEAASAEALRIVEGLPVSRVHGLIFRVQSNLRMLNRDTDAAVEWGERAIAVAERYDDEEVLASAENSIGAALLVAGNIEQGIARLERSVAIALASGAEAAAASALNNLGSGAGEVHAFLIARGYLDDAIAYCAERDLDSSRWYSIAWLALCQLHLGDWAQAGETAQTILREVNAPSIGRIMALIALGRLRSRRGDPGVWEALDEALTVALPTGTLQRLGPVYAAQAEAAWLGGDRERCAREARAAYELAMHHQHAWFVGELAYWQWKSGELGDPPEIAAAPYFLQMTGEWEAAAAAWEALGCPYEAARARLESGDEHAMKQALKAFEKLDAKPAMAMTVKALRDLGARRIPRGPRPSTRAHAANLTAREAEVLQLLMAGRRNAEIANALFLSPKTVEHHVSSILAKLGASSRLEAVEQARMLGL